MRKSGTRYNKIEMFKIIRKKIYAIYGVFFTRSEISWYATWVNRAGITAGEGPLCHASKVLSPL